MGACQPDGNFQPQVQNKSRYQMREEDFLGLVDQLGFTPNQRKCTSGYPTKYACLNQQCKANAFHCDQPTCTVCSQTHQHCEMMQVESLLSLLGTRTKRQKKFLLSLYNHEREAFDRIEANRNQTIKRLYEQERLDYSNAVIRALADDKVQVQGKQVKVVLDRLKGIDRHMEQLSQELIRDYKKETDKLAQYFMDLQVSTLSSFANLKIEPFQHPDNPHNDLFAMVSEARKVKIRLKFQDQHWYNFVKNGRIPKQATTSLSIKQVKTSQISIMTGVSTSSVFSNRDAYSSQEVLAYVSGDGYVCEGGVERRGGRPVRDGETIKMVANLGAWRVEWWVGNEKLASAVVPEPMREQQLFWTVMMYGLGDQVDILAQ